MGHKTTTTKRVKQGQTRRPRRYWRQGKTVELSVRIDLSPAEHKALLAKARRAGVPLKGIFRGLILDWTAGKIGLSL
jgi:hypothetical protein